MSAYPDELTGPDAVLGVPACMVPDSGQQVMPLDDQQAYEHQQDPHSAWFPQPQSGPTHLDCNQFKQLYKQLNNHCQLMIQVFALTAPNRQHQQTAHVVKELLETYQVLTTVHLHHLFAMHVRFSPKCRCRVCA